MSNEKHAKLTDVFISLIKNNNTDTLHEIIQEIKDSIPQSQRIGKGIVWSLRQLRKQVISEKVPLEVKKHSLEVLISGDRWHHRGAHCEDRVGSESERKNSDVAEPRRVAATFIITRRGVVLAYQA